MSDRVKLARQMAAMSESRFIEIKPEPRTRLRRTNDWLFVEIPRERGGGRVPYTEEQLEAIRGGAVAAKPNRVEQLGKRAGDDRVHASTIAQ
jgi:hypothetical protein